MSATDTLKDLTPLQRQEHRMFTTLLKKADDRLALAKAKYDAAQAERDGYAAKLDAIEALAAPAS